MSNQMKKIGENYFLRQKMKISPILFFALDLKQGVVRKALVALLY
jgi:hypothetical protein